VIGYRSWRQDFRVQQMQPAEPEPRHA
jgi:hypothetical protein